MELKYLIPISAILLSMIDRATSISCYVCNTTSSLSAPFQCSEWFDRYDNPDLEPQDCSNVHGAKYCIKHIGRFEGGIGAKRYCSSKDLGNYCDYVKNKGDGMEYRSCIFTCDTDGCNHSTSLKATLAAFFLPLFVLLTKNF
ncbi:U-scoloptoxin(05)-Sm1a [Culicoides brevitarsis]|uniref:U-scoloptoxin(05)-Sm1a n=1 Tax=Culicoides brevitarsis TaxID=469753 RepID=UPI00307C3797